FRLTYVIGLTPSGVDLLLLASDYILIPFVQVPNILFFFLIIRCQPTSTLFPYTTLFRSKLCALLFRRCASSSSRRASSSSFFSRSEEHTSELQSRENLVCRLLLEKKTD